MKYNSQTISIGSDRQNFKTSLEIAGNLNVGGIVYSTRQNGWFIQTQGPEIKKNEPSGEYVELSKEEEKKFYKKALEKKLL
ncbi:hypothetical protein K2X96_00655 [Patescibacteria group bacterium]|nr:hypothetical protein [Patescibacteria group bacterium]